MSVILPPDAGFDIPSLRDYYYGDVGGTDERTPDFFFIGNGVTIYNQSDDKYTKMACGSYGIVHATNIHNSIAIEGVQRDPKEHWKLFVEKYNKIYNRDPLKVGSSLQDQLSFGKEKELIGGYTRLLTEQQICENIYHKRCVYTGSKKIDRKATRGSISKIAITGGSSGHIFAIVGYDKKKRYYICMNSYGKDAYDKGFFYVNFEDIDIFFSLYAIFDHKDWRTIDQWKLKINAIQREKLATGKRYGIKDRKLGWW